MDNNYKFWYRYLSNIKKEILNLFKEKEEIFTIAKK